MLRRLSSAFVVFGLLGASTPGFAGWVDSWLAAKIESSPGYFAGQTRGYYSVGSLSARWPSTSDYAATLELPRLKVGCGGIDVFMGGWSFLDFDYLVHKFQNILSSAPAAAFDLALQALSPQAAQTIKDLEALADRLNAIQLDDCKTAKALVTVGADAVSGQQHGVTTAVQEYMTESGIADFYQKTKETIRGASVVVSGASPDIDASVGGITSGCPDDVKLLLRENSVLQAIGVGKLGLDASFVSFIRGVVGDIQVRGGGGGYLVSVEPPCPENDGKRLDAVLDGDVWEMDAGYTCSRITDANANLREFVSTRMQGIADRIRAPLPLDAAQTAFVNETPLPLLQVLKAAVGTQQEPAVILSLADLVAKAYALELLADVYRRAEIIVDTVAALIDAQRGPKAGEPSYSCQIHFVSERVSEDLYDLRLRLRDHYAGLQRSYAASAQELDAVYRVVEHLRRMDGTLYREASSRLGRAAGTRAQAGH